MSSITHPCLDMFSLAWSHEFARDM
uniref:Uncharacterized protein n=1 Tax=Rhizophora mucronata TaxID=61149 RepID=A0A2P2Q3U5_RHIMU